MPNPMVYRFQQLFLAMLTCRLLILSTIAQDGTLTCCRPVVLMLSGGRLEADISSMPFSSILGLHLDRHEAEVAAIINAASKELTIELELKKLNEMWREQRLEVYKYTRGGAEERGLILRGTLSTDKTIHQQHAAISMFKSRSH